VTVVIAAVAVVLLVAIGLIAYSRRPRQDAGLTSFRRHIDALSPESRREVMDRVRPSEHNGDLSRSESPRAEPPKSEDTTEPQEPTN
jgi:hypothetical protein